MGSRFQPPPWPKEKNAQKPDGDELAWLVLRNGPTRILASSVRLRVTKSDLECSVPVFERLWRS